MARECQPSVVAVVDVSGEHRPAAQAGHGWSSVMSNDRHICPACRGRTVAPGDERIIHCRVCGHRWMWTSASEQRRIEQAVYTGEYAGYRADPVFEQAIRALLDAEI